jgi:hypothetical protein
MLREKLYQLRMHYNLHAFNFIKLTGKSGFLLRTLIIGQLFKKFCAFYLTHVHKSRPGWRPLQHERQRVLASPSNPQAGAPARVGYPILLIQCASTYRPCLVVFSTCNLKTPHAAATNTRCWLMNLCIVVVKPGSTSHLLLKRPPQWAQS